jgi:threonine dehydrogenase-like Zn-dependent dehydrogenase
MSTMLAAVLHDFNNLTLDQVEIPQPTTVGSVVVRIQACGICATDYKAITGRRRNVNFPFIPGHEPSGIVAAVGPGVRNFKEGDPVIVQPSGYCGLCENCRTGNTHFCKHAYTTGGDGPVDVWPGAFAEYMLTMENTLFHKPAALSFDVACLSEPLSGAWKGMIQYSQMQVAEDVVVIGVGSIGLMCLLVARAAGAGRLVAVDTSPHARRKALELGATQAFDPSDPAVRDQIYASMPAGPDLVIEAAGPIEAVRLMVDLRRRGTRWNVFGITTHETFELDGGVTHFLEGRMDASFGTTPLAMSRAIRLLETGLVNLEPVISHRFPLAQIHQALAVMPSPDRNKIIINP